MTLVVEDGTGLANAESYVTVAYFDAYMVRLGRPAAGGDDAKEAALRRGSYFLDGAYRDRFTGSRLRGRRQAMEWPRASAAVRDPASVTGYSTLPQDEVPEEVKRALCEAAARELAKPGSLLPDTPEGGEIKTLNAGSVGITYVGGRTGRTLSPAIELALAPLLASISAGASIGRG